MGTLRGDMELVGWRTSYYAGEVNPPPKWEPTQTFVLDIPVFFALTLLAPPFLQGGLKTLET